MASTTGLAAVVTMSGGIVGTGKNSRGCAISDLLPRREPACIAPHAHCTSWTGQEVEWWGPQVVYMRRRGSELQTDKNIDGLHLLPPPTTLSPLNSNHQRRHQSHSPHHPPLDPNPHPTRRRPRRARRARRIGRRRPRRCRRPRHSGASGRGAPALDLVTRHKATIRRRPGVRHRAHILAPAASRLDHDPIRARGACTTFSYRTTRTGTGRETHARHRQHRPR